MSSDYYGFLAGEIADAGRNAALTGETASTTAGIIRYLRKDGTEATAEVEPDSSWTAPDDCAAVTGMEWPPGAGGSGHVGAVAGGGAQAEVEVAPGRTYVVGPREPCEEDDGLRKCCGTRQLGPHAPDYLKPPSFQDGMAGHERMYRHETEVRDD